MTMNHTDRTSFPGSACGRKIIPTVLVLVALIYLGGCADALTGADPSDSEVTLGEAAKGGGRRGNGRKNYREWAKELQGKLKKGRHFHLLEDAVIPADPSASKAGAGSDSVRIVVGFGNDAVTADSILNRVARKFKIFNRYEYKKALKGMAVTVSANNLDTFLTDMDNDPDISSTEPDPALPVDTTVGTTVVPGGQEMPWGVADIGADSSWARSGDGTGTVDVDIYIVDTGAYHADLNVVDCIEFSGSIRGGACASLEDPGEHGTGVAGVAAAIDDLDGIVGVAPGARVHAIQALNAGGNIVLGKLLKVVDYLTEQKLANPSVPMVVNMSLGADVRTTRYNRLDEAIQASIAAGVVYVLAAGNDGIDAATVTPAHVAEAITVGSYSHAHQFSWFSNYGSVVDILAPGEDVLTLTTNNELIYNSGTSLSAPHVTGAAALLLAQDPTLTPAQVHDLIVSSSTANISGMPAGTTNRSLNVRP